MERRHLNMKNRHNLILKLSKSKLFRYWFILRTIIQYVKKHKGILNLINEYKSEFEIENVKCNLVRVYFDILILTVKTIIQAEEDLKIDVNYDYIDDFAFNELFSNVEVRFIDNLSNYFVKLKN